MDRLGDARAFTIEGRTAKRLSPDPAGSWLLIPRDGLPPLLVAVERVEPHTGCACTLCLALAAVRCADADRITRARRALEALRRVPAANRVRVAREWPASRRAGVTAELLAFYAGRAARPEPDATPRQSARNARVERARAVPILEAAQRLGLGPFKRAGHEHKTRCPFHNDSSPSLCIVPAKARAFCNPCGRSWDAIQLVRDVRRCAFPDAVRFLIGGTE